MKTISTKAVIGPDRMLTVQLPADVMPGEHDVVVVLNGAVGSPAVTGPPYPFRESDPSVRFSREELYGDDDS